MILVVAAKQRERNSSKRDTKVKDEINVPIALSAFRDKETRKEYSLQFIANLLGDVPRQAACIYTYTSINTKRKENITNALFNRD